MHITFNVCVDESRFSFLAYFECSVLVDWVDLNQKVVKVVLHELKGLQFCSLIEELLNFSDLLWIDDLLLEQNWNIVDFLFDLVDLLSDTHTLLIEHSPIVV